LAVPEVTKVIIRESEVKNSWIKGGKSSADRGKQDFEAEWNGKRKGSNGERWEGE
jgi:hypothetical protein